MRAAYVVVRRYGIVELRLFCWRAKNGRWLADSTHIWLHMSWISVVRWCCMTNRIAYNWYDRHASPHSNAFKIAAHIHRFPYSANVCRPEFIIHSIWIQRFNLKWRFETTYKSGQQTWCLVSFASMVKIHKPKISAGLWDDYYCSIFRTQKRKTVSAERWMNRKTLKRTSKFSELFYSWTIFCVLFSGLASFALFLILDSKIVGKKRRVRREVRRAACMAIVRSPKVCVFATDNSREAVRRSEYSTTNNWFLDDIISS